MRNIKFRAWDKVSKTMYTDAVNNCKDSFDMILKHPQVYEVMQYTGLKDKDGVEIYEGDIVKCKIQDKKSMEKHLNKLGFGEMEYKYRNYVIEWWSSQFQCGYRVRNKGNTFIINQGTLNNMKAVIISDIHENPELFENKKC
jgi:uncharacterized phage protein (TIGR01671 family)